ncbi:hypothetical protein ACWC5I_03580 [Kitasatospora sp. NPDC001574]
MSPRLATTCIWTVTLMRAVAALGRAADVGPTSRLGRKIMTIAVPAAGVTGGPRRSAAEAIVTEISSAPATVVVIVATDAALDYSDAGPLAGHEPNRSRQ